MTSSEIDAIIQQYEGKPSNLLAILQDIQVKEKFLPQEILQEISQRTNIPLTHIFRLATFYNALSIKPRGRHKIDVCLGTACHVRGGERIMNRLERDLGIAKGETTKDKKFTLDSVRCVGCCSLGPVVVIDGNVFGRLTQDKVTGLLKEFK
ncbi:MAG: NAD(P)H-dependent oxidoreductase subunit E [Thermodesulfobacteriota bacterium]